MEKYYSQLIFTDNLLQVERMSLIETNSFFQVYYLLICHFYHFVAFSIAFSLLFGCFFGWFLAEVSALVVSTVTADGIVGLLWKSFFPHIGLLFSSHHQHFQMHLYKRVCFSIHWSIHPLICPSIDPSLCLYPIHIVKIAKSAALNSAN